MTGQSFSSMAAMMVRPDATAPIPTQTYSAANIIGTPVPQVGDNKARPVYSSAVGAAGAVNHTQIVLVVVGLFALGYVLYHINFEK